MDMYPGWSPYNYTLNNPVKYTDPTGMAVETDYEIDGNGKITKVAGTENNEGPDRLVRGRARYKNNGKLRGKYVEVEKGALDNIETDGINENSQVFKTGSGADADKLYDFVAGSTNNEYGKYDVITGDGQEQSIFHTTFDWDGIENNSTYLGDLKKSDKGLQLISLTHSHGNDPNSHTHRGSYGPSGEPGGEHGDIPQAGYLNNIIFGGQSVKPTYSVWRYGVKTKYNEGGKIKR